MQSHLAHRDTWRARCGDLLRSNQVQAGDQRYTRPAPMTYEQQWLWDSAFHAITYRHIDPDMAAAELRSLISKQVQRGADAGMIPHMNYWDGLGTPLWGQPDRSSITQPPLIAVAAWRVYETTGDHDLLRDLYPALVRYHQWFQRRRTPDDDQLITLIHPWESGWDASPRWDAPMGLSDPTPDQTKAARHALAQRLIAHDGDVQTLRQQGSFAVKPLDTNAIRAADLGALAAIAGQLGQPVAAQQWQAQADAVRAAIRQKMYVDGRPVDLAGATDQPLNVPSAAPFVLLFGGVLAKADATHLVQALSSPGFAAPYPVPTTPLNAPRYDGSAYWRGNVWMSVNWLIYDGLKTYGFHEAARHIAGRSLDLVERSGFHEYFNPVTGQGYGPARQSWTAVVLDMLERESA